MKTIWKWEITHRRGMTAMPKGAEILTVQLQDGLPQIWAVVDPDAKKEQREFTVLGTGHAVPSGATYIGTYQQRGLGFVGHLFETT